MNEYPEWVKQCQAPDNWMLVSAEVALAAAECGAKAYGYYVNMYTPGGDAAYLQSALRWRGLWSVGPDAPTYRLDECIFFLEVE